jgi:hypothetical protein
MSRSQHPQVHIEQDVWIECTTCGTASYETGTPHFASVTQARQELLDEHGYGWSERADGRLLCRSCSKSADCAERGHQMGPWRPHPRDPQIAWRYCAHCGGNARYAATFAGFQEGAPG